MTLSKKIEHLRKTKKMTQDFLADKLGVSRQTIYKWETGENKPEVDKLVSLSKLFDVSLDLLLDDNFDLSDEVFTVKNNSTPVSPSYRNVFISKYTINEQQSSFDHCSPKGYKGVNPCFWDYFQSRENTLQKEMKSKGYTNTVALRHDVAMSFFVDQKRKVFGIYGNHHEYFVCPFENFISASHTGGGKDLLTTPHTNVGLLVGGIRGVSFSRSESNELYSINDNTLIISYFKKDGTPSRYTVPCNFETGYMLTEKTVSKDPQFSYKLMYDCAIESAKKNIEKIITILSEIKAVAERDKQNGDQYEEIDLDLYKKNETKGHELHLHDIGIVMVEMNSHNKKQTIKDICFWSFVVLLFGSLIVGGVLLLL